MYGIPCSLLTTACYYGLYQTARVILDRVPVISIDDPRRPGPESVILNCWNSSPSQALLNLVSGARSRLAHYNESLFGTLRPVLVDDASFPTPLALIVYSFLK
jgi:hypothetical protein